MLLADRGYDADWIRELASKRGVLANIPPRCIAMSPFALARTSTVRATWSNGSSIGSNSAGGSRTRYDKLAANYLAFIQLASIRLWLRVNECTP